MNTKQKYTNMHQLKTEKNCILSQTLKYRKTDVFLKDPKLYIKKKKCKIKINYLF